VRQVWKVGRGWGERTSSERTEPRASWRGTRTEPRGWVTSRIWGVGWKELEEEVHYIILVQKYRAN